MSVKQSQNEDVVVLSVSGKLMGGEETQEVHEYVKNALADNIKKMIIDLSKVKWLNSSGLGMLVSCLTSCKNAQCRMALVGVIKSVKSLFMVTRLITVFDTYETIQEATEKFN